MIRVILFISISASFGCASSNKIMKPCKEVFDATVLLDKVYEGDYLVKDSMQKRIKIVFEQTFNDSISVFINKNLFRTERIVTDKVLGVSKIFIDIDYSAYKKEPFISFVFIDGKDCIGFYPVKGKQMAYVNKIEDAWSIELSNILREYY